MSSFSLKVLAIALMLIDHIGGILFPDIILLRVIGRLSFPIFAWHIAIGYKHTSNISKYFMRLLMFGVISQIPYSLAFNTLNANIFFTLALGLFTIYGYNRIKNKYFGILFCIFLIMFGQAIEVDYGAYGVALVVLFHVLQNRKIWLILSFSIITIIFSISIGAYIQIFSILAFIPIYLYNGKQGYKLKYLFYIFYPAHLLLLFVLKLLIQ